MLANDRRVIRSMLVVRVEYWWFGWNAISMASLASSDSAAQAEFRAMMPISFAVGVLCFCWLIRLLVADRLHWFAIYCLIVGSLTIVWQSG